VEPVEIPVPNKKQASSTGPGDPDGIQDLLDEQDQEAEDFAKKFLMAILRLRGVRIEREHFLKSELHKRGISQEDITQAVQDSPAAVGIDPVLLDEIAQAAIDFERNKTSSISFATGLPGGLAMFATVPGDLTQFYVHVFRVMQKLAYIYGWQSFLEDTEDVDDETLGKLASFLGVMMGVAGAAGSLRHFAATIARPAIEKNIAKVALTKTVWYGPMKQTLRVIGVHVTKQSFARTVTKVVPLVGGAMSGGFTYVTFNAQSKRLMQHLRELPPPNVDAAEYLAAAKRAETATASSPEEADADHTSETRGRFSAKRLSQAVTPTLKNARSAMGKTLNAMRRPKPDDPTDQTPGNES
jgi:hypothetical protein